MALYTFKCDDCSHTFDMLQRMDAVNPPCPECGSTTQKQLSAPSSLELKGAGFYKPGIHTK